MEATIKPNYQISIPFELIKELKLSVNDKVDLESKDGKIVISKKKNKKKPSFLDLKNSIKVGPGDIEKDIEKMKKMRAAKIAKSIE